MKINEKHHQRRISTSRRVNIIGQSNFPITFTLRPRRKGTPHSPHSPQPGGLSNDRNPSDGSNIVPRRHTQLRTHARTNETNTISRLDSPPNLRLLLTLLRLLLLLRILILLLLRILLLLLLLLTLLLLPLFLLLLLILLLLLLLLLVLLRVRLLTTNY